MNYKKWVDGSSLRYKVSDNEDGLNLEVGSSTKYYYPNGFIEMEAFFLNGILNRESGPAKIKYNPDGSIHSKYFYLGGLKHRKDGPAIIYYYPDGSIDRESFYVAGDFLGCDKVGFWALWKRLDELRRQAPDMLRCLARFS